MAITQDNSHTGSLASQQNPIGLRGVSFIEYSGSNTETLEKLFQAWGFVEVGALANKAIKLFRQGQINFILNTEPGTFSAQFAKKHGPCISATGFLVDNATAAFEKAVARGAKAYLGSDTEKGACPFPAIYGIGESLIYFMDQNNSDMLFADIFKVKGSDNNPPGVGFSVVDHFTNNVPRGEMQKWCDFYEKVFNFRETRFFTIKGEKTGLISKVMRSPCGSFSVPINEPTEGKSQIQEYLDEYKGSGIQHLALLTNDIVKTLKDLKSSQLEFLTPPPNTYYKMLKDRLPTVTEDLTILENEAVLVDGDHDGYLLQIFSKNIIGPIFFEVIQRKNHFGFGEGNFQALFDAIERDQAERGYL